MRAIGGGGEREREARPTEPADPLLGKEPGLENLKVRLHLVRDGTGREEGRGEERKGMEGRKG